MSAQFWQTPGENSLVRGVGVSFISQSDTFLGIGWMLISGNTHNMFHFHSYFVQTNKNGLNKWQQEPCFYRIKPSSVDTQQSPNRSEDRGPGSDFTGIFFTCEHNDLEQGVWLSLRKHAGREYCFAVLPLTSWSQRHWPNMWSDKQKITCNILDLWQSSGEVLSYSKGKTLSDNTEVLTILCHCWQIWADRIWGRHCLLSKREASSVVKEIWSQIKTRVSNCYCCNFQFHGVRLMTVGGDRNKRNLIFSGMEVVFLQFIHDHSLE